MTQGQQVNNLSGNWSGKKQSITPDLQNISTRRSSRFNVRPYSGQEQKFLFA